MENQKKKRIDSEQKIEQCKKKIISLYVKVTFYKLKGSKATCHNDF